MWKTLRSQTQSGLSYQFFLFTLSESLLSQYNTTVSISFSVSVLISFYYAFSLLRILVVVTVITVALELLEYITHSFTDSTAGLAGWLIVCWYLCWEVVALRWFIFIRIFGRVSSTNEFDFSIFSITFGCRSHSIYVNIFVYVSFKYCKY